MVVYETDGYIVGIRRKDYITIGRLIFSRESVGELDEIIRNTTSDDINVAFHGLCSLGSVLFSDKLGELLEGGRVKAIRAGYHFGDDSSVEALDPLHFGPLYTSFNLILNKGCQSIEELSLTRFAINDDTVSHFADGIDKLLKLEYLALCDLRCSEAVFVHLIRRLVSNFNNLRYLTQREIIFREKQLLY
jgi:hypothetical protein